MLESYLGKVVIQARGVNGWFCLKFLRLKRGRKLLWVREGKGADVLFSFLLLLQHCPEVLIPQVLLNPDLWDRRVCQIDLRLLEKVRNLLDLIL